MIDYSKMKTELQCFAIFQGLLQDPVVLGIQALLECLDRKAKGGASPEECAGAYAAFVAELYRHADNFSDYLKDLVLEDVNPYIVNRLACDMSGSPMRESLIHELSVMEKLSGLTCGFWKEAVGYDGFLPSFHTTPYDYQAIYASRMKRLSTRGYGMFAKYHVFTVAEGKLVPVRYPDSQRLSQLSDYERERGMVAQNTLALLKGEPASNVLLYGDAGTGKSSTIKAIANEYRDQGLRLIEVKKNQLYQIPELMEALSGNPLKFILFIDDLSFSSNDSDFAALKAILEGSVSGKSQNLAVYATSNRRHLVKETLSGREGDEIHLNDTMQELMSLSARFGLVITYSKPDKDVYLSIVRHLAEEYGVEQEEAALFLKAEAFAIRSGGRSPRVAKQFIEQVKTGIK